MAGGFTKIAFTPAVKAVQKRYGARERNRDLETEAQNRDRVTPELAAFLAARTSFYFGTASADGQPYVQHRGGPPGFLQPLDARTLAFPDYAGNRQYISLGNLTENPRAFIFLMDYSERQRVKLWGRAEIVEDDPELIERLAAASYGAYPQRAIRFHLAAWDINCKQHIPQLFTLAEVTAASEQMLRRIAELEAEVEQLRRDRGAG